MSTNQKTPFHQPAELSLDQCIKCNICTTVCPVMPVTGLFPGPKYEAPQAGRFRSPLQASPDQSVDYCSGCRACNLACPTGVKIAEINARARATMVSEGKFSLQHKIRNNLIARTELIGKIGQPVSGVSNYLLGNSIIRNVTQAMMGIHHEAPLPSFSNERFTIWFQKNYTPKNRPNKVVYFHGCSTEYYEPRVGRATINILEANGFDVIVPRQNCCGLPLLSNGEFDAARKYHQNNVNSMFEYAKENIPIVGTSTSCTLTLKDEAPELLDMHDEATQLVATRVYDLSEFLLILYDEGKLNLDLKPIPITIPYHMPCQYRAHALGKPAVEIMQLIPELIVQESHATCCGIAGTYGYKEEKYAIAMQVGSELFDFINNSGAPIAACDSETCRWQITHATGIPTIHPIELLAYSYGYQPENPLKKIFDR